MTLRVLAYGECTILIPFFYCCDPQFDRLAGSFVSLIQSTKAEGPSDTYLAGKNNGRKKFTFPKSVLLKAAGKATHAVQGALSRKEQRTPPPVLRQSTGSRVSPRTAEKAEIAEKARNRAAATSAFLKKFRFVEVGLCTCVIFPPIS